MTEYLCPNASNLTISQKQISLKSEIVRYPSHIKYLFIFLQSSPIFIITDSDFPHLCAQQMDIYLMSNFQR